MDLETFFTTLYVVIDDWYKAHMKDQVQRHVGSKPTLSDSEVLTLAVAGAWRVGVPWRSERGLVRYIHRHGRAMFPTMLERSGFNYRVRQLWRVLIAWQQWLAEQLASPTDVFEAIDCLPILAGTLMQLSRERGHWLWDSTVGYGAGGWFWGDHLLLSVTPSGVITGWLLGAAHINDRWLLEVFVSTRAGHPRLQQPPRRSKDARAQYTPPPNGCFIGAFEAVGADNGRPYVADRNFNGARWQQQWQQLDQAVVISVPQANVRRPWSPQWQHWLSHHRQIIDTVFARLDQAFDIKHLRAHSRWGQYTRLAAKTAAYNFAVYLNRQLGRPLGAVETLLC